MLGLARDSTTGIPHARRGQDVLGRLLYGDRRTGSGPRMGHARRSARDDAWLPHAQLPTHHREASSPAGGRIGMEGVEGGGPVGIQGRLFAALHARSRDPSDVLAVVPTCGRVAARRLSRRIPAQRAERGTRSCQIHPPPSAAQVVLAGVAMALSATIHFARPSPAQRDETISSAGYNDAFSFWK